ncbi:hypothetical protein MJO28_001814 [Puccinia striiformis f. sp. tritici]|uniref:Uncharacterized protein n=4 Tax=Puccinia striiformis TaxID=27350 RepID=A0A0L0W4D2_9BASI|nr:hypothetical protein MJO28_001814 [Puccinia striiformis f. sp. tritici]KAI7966111.1 hypothetical protein MJO29_001859 [Puccinia striiformis f. sp. tritici]KNF06354.1 hypothetical protein PSTG_00239 [Puccinia striiformis f. sp. tritici PST-78]POW02346.1 hypothetical protein PSHT_12151 [Puccinia striiformis]
MPSETVDNSSMGSTPLPAFGSPAPLPLDFWAFNDQSSSSFPGTFEPDNNMTRLDGLGIDHYPNTRSHSKSGLSQNNLAAFDSLFNSQEPDVPAPASSALTSLPETTPQVGTTTTTSSKKKKIPRFAPPKGPRKQHRTGFRQLPGINGVVKKGRPSKKEYKLGGVEVDMYSLKGVTLNGPAKSLDEVQGGIIVSKKKTTTRRSSSRTKPSLTEATSKAEPIIGSSAGLSVEHQSLQSQAPTAPRRQTYKEAQDLLFLPPIVEATNSYTNSYYPQSYNGLAQEFDMNQQPQQDFLAAYQSGSNDIMDTQFSNGQIYNNGATMYGDLLDGSSSLIQPQAQWDPNMINQPLSDMPQMMDNPDFQAIADVETDLTSGLVDPNLTYPPNMMIQPWDSNQIPLFTNPTSYTGPNLNDGSSSYQFSEYNNYQSNQAPNVPSDSQYYPHSNAYNQSAPDYSSSATNYQNYQF